MADTAINLKEAWDANWLAGYRKGWSAGAREPGHLDRAGYETGYQEGRRQLYGNPYTEDVLAIRAAHFGGGFLMVEWL